MDRASLGRQSCLAAVLVAGQLLVACDGDQSVLPTGVTLTVVSVPVLSSGVSIDGFTLTTRIGAADATETAIDLEGRTAESSETVNLVFGDSNADRVVVILVEGFGAGVSVGGGRVDVELKKGKLVAAEVLLRSCLAATGDFCDGDELVTCDASDQTLRTPCTFGCSEAESICNDCAPGSVACQGDDFVICYADGHIATREDCTALTDDCRTGRCSVTGCETAPQPDGTACEDGLNCTAGTTCTGGACGGGSPVLCDDGIECTFDTCVEATGGCDNDPLPFNNVPCGGTDFCLVGKLCNAGACSGGFSRDCDDGNSCTVDSCDETNAACSSIARADGLGCDDGDFCTLNETCLAGSCGTGTGAGTPRSCDDGNFCTTDVCDSSAQTCTNTEANEGDPCNDGSFCVISKTCSLGVCSGGTPRSCPDDDSNPCTFERCDEAAGACVADPAPMEGEPCDALFCAIDETCTAGSCGGGSPRPCDDSDSCTTDGCNETLRQCEGTYRGDGAPCEDGLFCTSGDTCGSGGCQPGGNDPCADGNPCTVESCDDAANVCSFVCAGASVSCLDATQQASCDGTCAPPTLQICGFGCNATRSACNECDPVTTRCAADLSLLCNAEIVCDAEGLVQSVVCCASNRCTCDGALCLEDVCAGSPDLSGGGSDTGSTCTEADEIPGDCNPGGAACRDAAQGGAPESFFQFDVDDGGPNSTFFTVTLDASASTVDPRLRVSTVCGNETRQPATADVCALPRGVTAVEACGDTAGGSVMVLCGMPEGTYYGAVDSAPGTCGDFDLVLSQTAVTLEDGPQAGNISAGGVFTGTTCGMADDFAFPQTSGTTGCPASGNDCVADECPVCDVQAANDCRVGLQESLCSYHGGGSPDAVFYLALETDSGVDISTEGSDFDTVLYIMETGVVGATPPGSIRICNDDCYATDGSSHIQTSLAAGLYYVYLDGGGSGTCGNYQMTVTVSPAASCPDLSCDVPFENCGTCPLDCACDSCGDGAIDPIDGEMCDDGGLGGGDGCSAQCAIEEGYTCAGEPSVCWVHCGDGVVDADLGERCDDGGLAPGDGCDASCRPEPGFICTGSPSACGASASITSCPGLTILDDSVTGVVDSITVSGSLAIGNATIDLAVTHTFIGDLEIDLRAPDGTTVRLHDQSGTSTADIIGNYDLTLTPDGPGSMSDFVGRDSDGVWTLILSDNAAGDIGMLDCWTLNLEATSACPNGVCELQESCSTCAADCGCANCGDGSLDVFEGEACDDGNTAVGDGCSEQCEVEPAFLCEGQPSVCTPGLRLSSCPGLEIPDNFPAGASDSLTVATPFVVGDVTVDVSIDHSFIGDIIVELTSPAATTVRLHNQTGGSNDDIIGNYDGTLTVDGPGNLSDFTGEAAIGSWTLTAADRVDIIGGTLACWSLNLRPGAVCPSGTCEASLGETCTSCPADCPCSNCPDGTVDTSEGEACDDNNGVTGDGCDGSCAIEAGFKCTGSPSACVATCGDGVLDAAEACDDGNPTGSDGCTSCTIDSGFICSGEPSVCQPGFIVSNCPNQTIRDNRTQGQSTNINVGGGCTVADVNVAVDISHSWIGDLEVDVSSPGGTTVRLHDHSGGSGSDILGVYDREITPDGPGVMDDFNGENAAGNWTLFTADTEVLLDGTLNCWSVELLCQ